MTEYFSVVIEKEDNGTYSAWVAGLPGVYAAADTAAVAKRSIRGALALHLAALRELGLAPKATAEVMVLRRAAWNARTGRERLEFAGLGALLGRKTSARKAEASRRNGGKGGRPRKAAARTAR